MPRVPVAGPGGRELIVQSLADQLYQILCERVVTGMYEPGQRLDPQEIAAEYGISRTPVRDALTRLEGDRLIETRPRAGTFVVRPTVQDVHAVCQLRKGIEWVATELATPLISTEKLTELREEVVSALAAAEAGDFEPFFESDGNLHRTIVEESGNEWIMHTRSTVEPFVIWLRVLGATGLHRIKGSTKRHLEIIDAMLERNAEAAKAAAALHLDEVEQWTTDDMPPLEN